MGTQVAEQTFQLNNVVSTRDANFTEFSLQGSKGLMKNIL